MINMRDLIRTKAYSSLKNVMLHWEFTDTEAAIYALLALSPTPLTAKEISAEVGRAYSSVINEINKLLRYGLLERNKGNRCYSYTPVIDIIKIIKEERRKVIRLLTEVKQSLEDIGSENDELKEHLEEAIKYLGKIEQEG